MLPPRGLLPPVPPRLLMPHEDLSGDWTEEPLVHDGYFIALIKYRNTKQAPMANIASFWRLFSSRGCKQLQSGRRVPRG